MSVIGIDCDGVLCDFNTAYIELVKTITGRDLFPAGFHPGLITTWSYPEQMFGYTKAEISAVWKWIGQDRKFWTTLEPLPGASDFINLLSEMNWEHSIYFITSRIGGRVKHQSEQWIIDHGWKYDDETPTVLISSEKGLCCAALRCDLYIDDKNENCEDVLRQSKTSCYMLAQPWNSLEAVGIIGNITRIYSLQEFKEVIENAK